MEIEQTATLTKSWPKIQTQNPDPFLAHPWFSQYDDGIMVVKMVM